MEIHPKFSFLGQLASHQIFSTIERFLNEPVF